MSRSFEEGNAGIRRPIEILSNLRSDIAMGLSVIALAGAPVSTSAQESSSPTQPDSSVSVESEQPEPVEDSIRRQFCFDSEGTRSIERIRVTGTGRTESARITIKTPDISSACDRFGERSVNSISFVSKGSAQKKWVKSSEMLKRPLIGNSVKTYTRVVDLNNRCKKGDRYITIKQVAVADYIDKKTEEKVTRTKVLPIRFAPKLKCS